MQNLPVALQLYSLRDDPTLDFAGKLRKVKEMGYDGVELAGFADMTPESLRDLLDEIGLVAISAHVSLDELKCDTAAVLAGYKTVGCQYIAIPYLDEQTRPGAPGFADTVEIIRKFGEIAKAMGLQLLYHNHDFEFVVLENGEFGLDALYHQVPADLLQTEFDTCWIKIAGQRPTEYLHKYAGRSPVVHLKDFYLEGDPGNLFAYLGMTPQQQKSAGGIFEFRPLGMGLQDVPAILNASFSAGAKWVVVEQDFSTGRSPLEAAALSREYLRGLGW